jgi:hypothetical protein
MEIIAALNHVCCVAQPFLKGEKLMAENVIRHQSFIRRR